MPPRRSPVALVLSLLALVACGPSPQGHQPSTPQPSPLAHAAAPGVSAGDAASPPPGWEPLRDEDGIKVYRREVEGSPVVAFRGEGVIEAPIARVALVQMDLAHTPEWVDRLVGARVVAIESDTDFLTYSRVSAPFPVSDRDFLNHVHATYAPPSRIELRLQSTEDPRVPPGAAVRGQLMGSTFEFTALGPTTTRVVCEIHADPKGSIPKWLVNQFQKAWAFKTISRMRQQVQRPDVVERAPVVRGILERSGFAN